MNILFTVCGRAGSKGIKNKNFKEFLGEPLVFYTLSVIDLYKRKHSELICDIAFNTDSAKMQSLVANGTNLLIYFVKRKPELALDDTAKVSVIADTLASMEETTGKIYDLVIDMDITSPLRTLEDVEDLIIEWEKSRRSVIFSITDSRRNPYFNMVKSDGSVYSRVIQSEFTARQQAPAVYDMNASLYAFTTEFLKSGKSMFDVECGAIKMRDTGILDLDHEDDFELMQVIAQYLFGKYRKFCEVKEHIEAMKG